MLKNLNLIPIFFAGICVLLLSSQALLAAPLVPNPPKVKAEGFILMDFNSDQVLVDKNADVRMEPASLTKIMSSYIISQQLKNGSISLTDNVTVSEKAWKMKGSRMFIEVGKKISVEDLLKGIIVQSGNDATIALAEFIAGSEESFVSLMNQTAEALGLSDTHFANATGLPHEQHYSTPRDLALLGKSLIRDFPEHYEWYSIKEYKFNNIKQKNRNTLLWKNDDVDGIKTGHTESAGYCLVASAKRKDMRLISVVLGTGSQDARSTESNKLLNYGFRFFETHRLYAANEALTNVRIWKGENEELPLGINEDLYITIPKGQYKNLDASMSINAEIIAPVVKGKVYGTVNIMLGKKNYAVRKLVALEDIEEGSLWKNLVDSFKLAIN
ncbi:MAG: D-alanyl-D-alanine carboxypeptidase [Gammaproteobacteria bacterium]|nr:D-alanyl-D-alanine carboxypeptidase [Gammaproteobacteria bacterium]MDH5801968.1 D-alanyl-D-alanine carboxypeptidase [Gammaproteobacteria bacterium]